MSQSRFSIVLVGVSALLRRPLVSRLRPADGERSSWVVFTARGGRFDSGFRSASWPSDSPLPLFGTHRFGDGRWASSFFRLPLRRFRSTGWSSGSLLPLFGMHRFGVALGGLAFGLTASDFRHAPIRSGRWAVGLRAYGFGDCHLAGWPSGSPLPLFGTRRFGVALGELAFGLTASAFRHAPLRRLPSAGWPSGSRLLLFGTHRFGVAAGRVRSSAFRFGNCPWRVGLRAHCFRFSACTDSHRRAAEARTDGAQRHDNCFTSKHLSQHVNLPHRTP